jgi:hypothetical protein
MIELVQRSKYDAFMHSQAPTCLQLPGLSLENWVPDALTKGAIGLQAEHLAEKLCQPHWIHSLAAYSFAARQLDSSTSRWFHGVGSPNLRTDNFSGSRAP